MPKFTSIAIAIVFAFTTWFGWANYSQVRLESQCDELAASFGGHLSNGRRSESSKYVIWCGSNGPTDSDAPTIQSVTTKIINAGLGQTEISLDLSKSQLSDSAIPALGAIRGLYFIDVSETEITKQGADALRSLMPDTIVRWSPKQE
ncbi:hypothetical protein LOC67_22615 [Stieleria sp. JC731]|uniref:hypothetical protein n=1 Tax=Stieleria sp. JC731 TaxID=2894195 RepID=UPI001E61E9A9|nr:hypothetical protein [Stieleria sp. JC731]MCC9603352.1 hypothetical protein [Stieleria sp. JC731]